MWYPFVRHIRDQPTGCTGLRHRHPVSYRERNLRFPDTLQFLIGNVVLLLSSPASSYLNSYIIENEYSAQRCTLKFPSRILSL